ncbi:hypothetical protein [Thermanaeromonas toyohensis]|uniref:hypothetical protein n=1 Tax=Thermanaeromonas toyohensis TaxID=161154 RepID=UPI000A0025F4|nr:hypothetical protein [Thermanaeromonas toyohensis]
MFLKILANSTSYGIFIELNREKDEEGLLTVYSGDECFHVETDVYENEGFYYNPLIAVMITGAARLILAMIQRVIQDLGGDYVFCDTDSLCIYDLQSDRPNLIGRKVVEKFRSLWPYEGEGSLLAAEEYNWRRVDWDRDTDKGNIVEGEYHPLYCYAVAAKRYCLFNLLPGGKIVFRKLSEHGLGHLSSPPTGKKGDLVRACWEYHIRREVLKEDPPEPEWFGQPAMARFTIGKPYTYNLFRQGKPPKGSPWIEDYLKKVKPFNFMVVAFLAEALFPQKTVEPYYCRVEKKEKEGICRIKSACRYSKSCLANTPLVPVAPYDSLENWRAFDWQDKTTGQPLAFLTEDEAWHKYCTPSLEPHPTLQPEDEKRAEVVVRTYGDFIKKHINHPEAKYDGEDGQPCGETIVGRLKPCHVLAKWIKYIGKEADSFLDNLVEEQVLQEQERVTYEANTNSNVTWEELRRLLDKVAHPRRGWARRLGISYQHLKMLLKGTKKPSSRLMHHVIEKLATTEFC